MASISDPADGRIGTRSSSLELVDAAAHQRLLARGFSCSMVRPSRRCFPFVTMASVEDLDASRSRGRRWTPGTDL
jgi:hypothetical protein